MPLSAHGSPRKAATGCTCNLCTRIRAVKRRPVPASVPAAQTREHLQELVDLGWTYAALAEETGYHPGTLSAIHDGRHQHISGYTAEDVLSVRLRRAPGHVDGVPPRPRPDLILADDARDRARALRAAGWTLRRIAAAAGCSRSSLSDLLAGGTRWVRKDIAAGLLATEVSA